MHDFAAAESENLRESRTKCCSSTLTSLSERRNTVLVHFEDIHLILRGRHRTLDALCFFRAVCRSYSDPDTESVIVYVQGKYLVQIRVSF